jgi:two-component system sensor histidine kinase MtrB
VTQSSAHPAAAPGRELAERAAAGARRTIERLAHAWQRSLQFRVGATTLVVTGVVVLLIGVFLVDQLSSGVLRAKRDGAVNQARLGLGTARTIVAGVDTGVNSEVFDAVGELKQALSSTNGTGGLFQLVILTPNDTAAANADVREIPRSLRAVVGQGNLAVQYAPLNLPGRRQAPGLIVGEAVPARSEKLFELYFLFPLTAEQQTIALVQRTVLLVGIALVLLVVVIALLVTRQVVRPVRVAAKTAGQLAAGDLTQRIKARGTDDIALLGQSFNEMADSLQRQIRRLEDLSRLQRRFTSDVSHELRTPLTTIRMASELLHGNREEFPPELARSSELLQAELDRFEALLGDLLEISRYDAGAAHLESEPGDIRTVVASAVEATRMLAERQGSEVVIEQPEHPVLVDMDSRRVERILRNLVGNALDHGDGKPVLITVAYDRDAVAIAVRDHGVGLRPCESSLVFNRFWRGDLSRSRLTGGTGLGLSIALEDARLHDGWLQAWGEPGRGAQFRLTLPRRAGHTLVHSPLPLDPNEVDEEEEL